MELKKLVYKKFKLNTKLDIGKFESNDDERFEQVQRHFNQSDKGESKYMKTDFSENYEYKQNINYKSLYLKSFTNPEYYLSLDNAIIVGKLPKPIQVKSIETFTDPLKTSEQEIKSKKEKIFNQFKHREVQPSSYYKEVAAGDLKAMYSQIEKREKENQGNSILLVSVPKKEDHKNFYKKFKLKSQFDKQKSKMKKWQTFEDETSQLSKRISQKLKVREDSLLLNKYNESNTKKKYDQFIYDFKHSKQPDENKHGDFSWYISLRRPKVLTRPRDIVINIGTEHKRILGYFNEVPPCNEISRKPDSRVKSSKSKRQEKDLMKFRRQVLDDKEETILDKVNRFDNLNFLKLEGHRQLDFEKQLHSLGSNKHFRLYTDPLMKTEDKVEKTICKNYY